MTDTTTAAPIKGWTVNNGYYERDDGAFRVNLSHDRFAARPFGIYTRGESGVFPVWASKRWATAEAAMRAADRRSPPAQVEAPTFQLDTSGSVGPMPGWSKPVPTSDRYVFWTDLDPFKQECIRAAFSSAVDSRGRMMMPRDGRYASARRARRKVGFRHLAPETLARFVEDCVSFQNIATGVGQKTGAVEGRRFWNGRQNGLIGAFGAAFPPQTLILADDGRVYFQEQGR